MKKLFFIITLLSLFIVACDTTETTDDYKPEEQKIILFLNLDKTSTYTGEENLITFKTTLLDASDVTAETDYYVNDVKITGNTFSSDTEGEFDVYCVYKDVTSEKQFFHIVTQVEAPASYTHKILVEDYTGSWCGYCPRIAYKLHEAETENENIIGIGIHYGDGMQYSYVNPLMSTYGVTGFPTAMLNRSSAWGEMQSELDYALAGTSQLGLAMNSSVSGNTLSVTVKVGFAADIQKELSLVVYLTEDSVVEDQRNYMNTDPSSPWYQAGDPIENFVHRNVLRKALTDIYGDPIPVYLNLKQNTYTTTLSTDISNYSVANLHLVAFVLESSSKSKVYNVQKVNAGGDIDFD